VKGLLPRGVEEAHKLGIYDLVRSSCGHEVNILAANTGPLSFPLLNYRETTPRSWSWRSRLPLGQLSPQSQMLNIVGIGINTNGKATL